MLCKKSLNSFKEASRDGSEALKDGDKYMLKSLRQTYIYIYIYLYICLYC